MIINGEKTKTIAVFPTMMTVPDCVVVRSNKLGRGHGEAKFYVAPKNEMYDFFGKEKFNVKCFMLKSDLISFMLAIKNEYFEPSQNYARKEEMHKLWNERMEMIFKLEDIIFFNIRDQYQIAGDRGYINSHDTGYKIIREIALPLVSYVYAEKTIVGTEQLFYWKLFVDFETIWEKQNGPLVFNYGKQKDNINIQQVEGDSKNVTKRLQDIHNAREGQGKYREQLLQQCRFCPITMISDDRLLIASHIKPWSASTSEEKIDPYNGYILSPLFDKLFDRGFITFTRSRHMILSDVISPYTWKQINLRNNMFIKALPMDEKRAKYLEFHHKSVFKGSYNFEEETIQKSSKIFEYQYPQEQIINYMVSENKKK